MPYARPTLTDLRDQVLQDINSAQITSANGTLLIGLLQKSILRVLAYAEAGLSYEHYAYIDWISLQSVPWTATGEFLEGWAALKGVYRLSATSTVGTATFTGANADIDVPPGTSVTRADGVLFLTTADAQTGSGSGFPVTVTIQAITPAAAGDFDAGTAFTLSTPISGIQAQSIASTQITAGSDMETDASFRTRTLAEYAAPPQGGDRQDYIEWALAVPGVTRAWVNPNGMGAGTIVVYVMLDISEAAFNGFPQGTNGVAANETRAAAATGDQLTVANALLPLQPVTSLVYVCAPTAQPVAFTIADLSGNNTAAMQASITAALQDMFLQSSNVGGTVQTDTGGLWPALEPAIWYAALSAISGLTSFKVTAPSAAVTPTPGNLLTLGAITFTS